MRVWVHCDCAYTPEFNHTGFVVATDTTGSLVRDLLTMADAAHASGIGVVLSLFNGALMSNQVKGLVEEDSKMESCAYSCIRASTASRPDGSARTDISTVLIRWYRLSADILVWWGACLPSCFLSSFTVGRLMVTMECQNRDHE